MEVLFPEIVDTIFNFYYLTEWKKRFIYYNYSYRCECNIDENEDECNCSFEEYDILQDRACRNHPNYIIFHYTNKGTEVRMFKWLDFERSVTPKDYPLKHYNMIFDMNPIYDLVMEKWHFL